MLVPLTTQDFLTRGATVHPDRIAVVDEPDQPAGSLGAITFAERALRACSACLIAALRTTPPFARTSVIPVSPTVGTRAPGGVGA